MQASVVIPIWNGETVLGDCLNALFARSSTALHEVICVDNASADGSARLIRAQYPQVTLLPQPVNLGFAGGVNVGLHAASGDVLVLLNQDCVVQTGWLDALIAGLADNPSFGIVGGTVLNADGSVHHAGACLQRPLAYGEHLHDATDPTPRAVDYVTGALFGITRAAWDAVGPLDDGFYPAYYEETDYCYRARRHGFEIGYVPGATAVHLFNNKEWQRDPVRHTANQHAMRYRFICKHFDRDTLADFWPAETAATHAEAYYDQAIGRLLGLRQTLQNLPAILERRQRDLAEPATAVHQRYLTGGLTDLLRHAFDAAETLGGRHAPAPPAAGDETWQQIHQRLTALQKQEHDLLARIYFRVPGDAAPEPGWKRLWRLGVLRPLSFITGRDYLLLAQLNTVHVARFDQMARLQRHIERRLTLLETLTTYEHR